MQNLHNGRHSILKHFLSKHKNFFTKQKIADVLKFYNKPIHDNLFLYVKLILFVYIMLAAFKLEITVDLRHFEIVKTTVRANGMRISLLLFANRANPVVLVSTNRIIYLTNV